MGDLGAWRCARLLCNQYGRKVTLVASSAPTIWTRLTPGRMAGLDVHHRRDGPYVQIADEHVRKAPRSGVAVQRSGPTGSIAQM